MAETKENIGFTEKFSSLINSGKSVEAIEFLDEMCRAKNVDAILTKAKITGYGDEQALHEYIHLIDEACELNSGEAWMMKGDVMMLLPEGGEEISALEDGISDEKKREFISKLPLMRKFRCYGKAAELGEAEAYTFLGETLLKPEYSFLAEKNAHEEAFVYFKQGAAKGNEKCVLHLAECIEEGIGTDRNPKKAVDIYRDLVEVGNTDAMLHLCEIYTEGREGVEADSAMAKKYMLMTKLSFDPNKD